MKYGMPMDEMAGRVLGHAAGKGIGLLFSMIFSKPLVYTGLWPFVILLILFFIHPTREWSDMLAMPIFLSWIFAGFWTSRNIYLSMKGKGVEGVPAGGDFDGVYFGEFEREVVGKSSYDDGHILIVGGPGSGKSAGIVIPTLKYFWPYP